MAEPSGPLDGLVVLDLTRVLVGPFATMLLGDMGAQVIKVERPGEGDETRHVHPLKDGESHYFMSINRNKKGIAVDMKSAAGKQILIDLAARADIFIENFRPGVAARLGLDQETLRALNPRLVYCSISAFGQTGPFARRSALDIAIQAMSGMMSVTGDPGGPPTRMGLPMADLCGALYAVVGVLAAIYERDRTGEGQFVDLSMLDGMVSLLMYMAGKVFITGEDSPKIGTGHYGIVPYGAFPAADGHIVIANIGETFWPKICAALGFPELATDNRYDTNSKRVARRAEVDTLIATATATRTVAAWDEILEAEDVPHAPILPVSEVLKHPQVIARGMVAEVDHARLGRFPALGRAIRFPAHENTAPMAGAPLLGQHTREILESVLGYPADAIAALLAEGIIAEPDPPAEK